MPVDPGEVRRFCALCDQIENGLHQKADVSELLARWNQRANRKHEPREFLDYSGAIDTEVFVRIALAPPPRPVADLSYAELRSVVESVTKVQLDEAEQDWFLNWLEVQLPGASVSGLLFQPAEWFGVPEAHSFEFTADQLLRAAMTRSGRHFADAPEVVLPFEVRPPQRVLVT
ncbi:MAG: hypothetical protein Q8L48_17285 [Archangium sp.]|nr:hypothetical protein [Archangium sp.]